MKWKDEIENVCEYLNVRDNTDLLLNLFNAVHDEYANHFGKTEWASYALEVNYTGEDTGYEELYEPILQQHREVHPDWQKRSTGFNYSDSTDKDLFAHTDIDQDTEHPNHYNIVIPVMGQSTIWYYHTNDDEICLPEKNAHGYYYYHEFKNRKKMGPYSKEYEDFQESRKWGKINVTQPLLLNTNFMHRVIVTEAPRLAWVTRWNNIPSEVDFQTFKNRVETILA